MNRRALFSFALILVAATAAARQTDSQAPTTGSQTIPQTAAEIVVDGVLDEPAWQKAWTMELAYEVEPGENVPAPVRTEVLAIYDEAAVYFAFRAYDPEPTKIRAHLSDRDNVGADDWVAVILDTFNDERRSFDFLVNPLGVQSDFVETSGDDGGGAWDTIWDSAGSITGWGYVVEMRIPFSSLRFQRADGPQTWGFDAVRSYPRSQRHHIALFPRDRDNNCYLCQAIKIEGFEGVSPGRNLEVVPTITGLRTDVREQMPEGEMVEGDVDVEAGITARWGFTNNLTLSGTINPDFSQVEADARQLEVNERFALFYPDKRPFFMEGADFFSSRLQLLHTRAMYDPVWGLKLTGKEGEHTVGVYVVEDDVTHLLFPGSEGSQATSLHEPSTDVVLRYKRDVGNNLTLGTMFTNRQADGYENSVFEIDGNWRITDKDRVQLEILGTRTEYPDEIASDYDQPHGDFDDWAMDLLYTRRTRHVDFWALYQRVGEGVRTDLGFNPQVGHEAVVVGSEYKWIPEGETWFSHLEVGLEYVQMDHEVSGDLISRDALTYVIYEGPLQSHSTFHIYYHDEGYEGERFPGWDYRLHHCMKPTGNSHVYLNVHWGDRVDYANTQPGERLRVQPGLILDLGRHFELDLSYLYESMDVDQGELYTAKISQGTFTYQFTTRTFVRAILQYVDNSFDPTLYVDEVEAKEKDLFVQLLFSYKLNPQTVAFLGYSESSWGNQDYSLTTRNRTLFAKVGYAWRL